MRGDENVFGPLLKEELEAERVTGKGERLEGQQKKKKQSRAYLGR